MISTKLTFSVSVFTSLLKTEGTTQADKIIIKRTRIVSYSLMEVQAIQCSDQQYNSLRRMAAGQVVSSLKT